jgi:hypothetical protein
MDFYKRMFKEIDETYETIIKIDNIIHYTIYDFYHVLDIGGWLDTKLLNNIRRDLIYICMLLIQYKPVIGFNLVRPSVFTKNQRDIVFLMLIYKYILSYDYKIHWIKIDISILIAGYTIPTINGIYPTCRGWIQFFRECIREYMNVKILNIEDEYKDLDIICKE